MLFSEALYRCEGDRVAIATLDGECTYAQLHGAIAGFAAHLQGLGVASGTRVALWAYNSVGWLVAFFAIVRAGGVAVLVNYSMGIDDAAELLISAGATHIICGDNGQTKRNSDALGALADAAGIARGKCVDMRTGTPGLVEAFAGASGIGEMRSADEAGETAFIIFTSGTTSRPKAVCISQRALSCDARAIKAGLEGTMGPSVCVSVPLFHILGLLVSYVYLTQGATVCLAPSFRADALIPLISAYRASDMAAVGAVYQSLASAESFKGDVAPHLRTCLIAGGMTTPVQMMRMELDYTHATFINMYGQSEGAPLSMVRPSDLVEQRASTVGRAVEGVELRIAGADGASMPVGEVGEVLARGACLMNGYEGLPEEDQAIDLSGWLHTGDLGYIDEQGNLHLAGRLKDVIIRGGENIAPAEVEAELTALAGVREAKVMGVPHPVFGESVEACVEVSSPAEFDAERAKNALRARLPRYKVPAHVFAYGAFPLNVNGKIDQHSLYADLVVRLRTLEVDDELAGGIVVYDLVMKNTVYAITPIAGLVESLANDIGFEARHASKVRLATEEMLVERITDAYSGAGDIRVRATLMAEWLRITFGDDGVEYVIDKRRDTSLSARIILGSVDNFQTAYRQGRPEYHMDFLYGDDLDIKDFLVESRLQEAEMGA